MAYATSSRPRPGTVAVAMKPGVGTQRPGRPSAPKEWSDVGRTRQKREFPEPKCLAGPRPEPRAMANALGQHAGLWMRDGNCFVYLYGRGQAGRGPDFRVPFAALVTARCFPFIWRFLATDGYRPQTVDNIIHWYRLNPRRTVDLYVPAPAGPDQSRAAGHRMATRNLLAWAVRRPLAGESLGGALVTLLRSLGEARPPGEDNVAALMDYLEGQGYLTLTNRPGRALAVLHLAETFRLRETYAVAFVHCVGMMNRLASSPEHRKVSAASRALIGKARGELDGRLARTASMLRNMLDEELSETHLGIPTGARAHLERFRSFLLSFYTVKLGYYPPREFSPSVLRAMADDFAALYALLADDGYGSSGGEGGEGGNSPDAMTMVEMMMMPSAAAGGICTTQLVRAFDAQHGFEPLPHPLPLLPQPAGGKAGQGGGGGGAGSPRRISRLGPWGKGKRDMRKRKRLAEQVALLAQASNRRDSTLSNNLVRAYVRFEEEEEEVAAETSQRRNRVSPVDSRKVRWIVTYALHQTLRHAVYPPAGVLFDDADSRYLLSARTDGLPPWREEAEAAPAGGGTMSSRRMAGRATATAEQEVGGGGGLAMEIKPDVDYFALTHKTPPASPPRSLASRGRQSSLPPPVSLASTPPSATRSSSLGRILGRGSTLRRPVRKKLTKVAAGTATATAPATAPAPGARPSYHEILVHGYGNGTEAVITLGGGGGASRSGSTASHSASSASTMSSGLATTVTTAAATAAASPVETCLSPTTESSPSLWPLADTPLPEDATLAGFGLPPPLPLPPPTSPPSRSRSRRRSQQQHKSVTPVGGALSSSPRRRPMSAAIGGYHYAKSIGLLVEQQGRTMLAGAVSVSRRHSVMGAAPELRRWGSRSASPPPPPPPPPPPQAIDEEELPRDSGDWTAMQAFFDRRKAEPEPLSWEQWADLGGLTEPR